jgi:hypothetical protein
MKYGGMGGGLVRENTFNGVQKHFLVLKVPRLCPLFLLVEILLRDGRCYEQSIEIEQGI